MWRSIRESGFVSRQNLAQDVEDWRIGVDEGLPRLVWSAVNVRGSKPEIC
jgi:hypothetical protein